MDSGALLHMTPNVTSITCCCPPPYITRVRIVDGTPLLVSFIGHLTTSSFFVPSISHVPRIFMNLMSVSQLTDFDDQIVFDRTSCRVQNRSGAVIGVGRHHSGVYALESLRLLFSLAPVSHCHVAILDFHR